MNFKQILTKQTLHNLRQLCSAQQRVGNKKWEIFAAVCLERKPLILPQMTPFQRQFRSVLNDIELERSLKSEMEARHEKEISQLEQLKKGGDDVDVHLNKTAQDILDADFESLTKFKESLNQSQIPDDKRSIQRKLDKHLVLVLKQELGNKTNELLPFSRLEKGENLRQAADRALKSASKDGLIAIILGNSPSGFYQYKYPKKIREKNGIDFEGAKIFFYFARYISGQVDEDLQYQWLDREELKQSLHKNYGKKVLQFLIDEN